MLFVDADTGCSDLAIDPQDGSIALRRDVAVPPQAVLLHLGRPGQRPLQVDRRRRDLAQADEGPARGRARAHRARGRPVAHRASSTRWSRRSRRRSTAPTTPARAGPSSTPRAPSPARPFYFSHLAGRPDATANRVYKPGFTLSVSDDGGKTFSGVGGGGLFGPTYHSDTTRSGSTRTNPDAADPRHRRRRLHLARPRHALALRGEPAGLAVLPRELRHGVPVQRLRRPAGQRHLDGPSRRASGRRSGTSTGTRSRGGDGFWAFVDRDDPDIVYTEYQGGNLHPHPQVDARDEGHQALAEGGRAGVPLQLEHADPLRPNDTGTIYYRRAVPVPLARPRRDLGADLARPHHQRSRPSRSRTSRAASRSTTRRPRTTARSTRSPSRRRTAT